MELLELKQNALREIDESKDVKTLESVRVKYLGRENGELTVVLKSLKTMSIEERKNVGPLANELRNELEDILAKKLLMLEEQLKMGPKIDITIPGTRVEIGHLHPPTIIEDRIKEIFAELNFSIVEGPEVETEHYNFDALNIPAGHPARDMWDTFWLCQNEIKNQKSNIKIEENLLLRTHTSPMQIRYMETHEPPFQIIVPGRVFRFEAIDAAHQINFHQVEGLMVGQDVSLANFKYIISEFFKALISPSILH
jgi:phenylalanyl-tRNA synthetase alpha chain